MKFCEMHLNFSEFIYISMQFSDISMKFQWAYFFTEFHWNISEISLNFTTILLFTKFQWNFIEFYWNFTDHFQ